MKYAIGLALWASVAAGALIIALENRGYTQSIDPNAAPNPYKVQENWAQLPADRKFGGVIKDQVDHSDGKSMCLFDRCGSNEFINAKMPPLLMFVASGKFERVICAVLFAIP